MPRIMQLVPIGGRLGVVLDVPPNDAGSVSLYSEAEIEGIIKAEREACALLAERIGVEQYEVFSERDPELVGDDIAKAIRNRSN